MRLKTSSSTLLPIGLVIVAACSSGCATAVSRLVTTCPAIVRYDQAFLDRAADELVSLPEDSALDQMMRDYLVMRDQARACRS